MTEDTFPFKEICKRDGRVVPFDPLKITQAIFKAAKAMGGEDYALAQDLTGEVIAYLQGQQIVGLIPSVEEIQDAVEKILIEKGHARTAKAYILYRAKRTRIREAKSELMDVVKDILLFEGNRNRNKESQYSPAGKMHRIALAASQKYYFANLLPAEIAAAHQQGSFHIHCPGYYSKTLDSLQLDLFPIIKKGFDQHEKAPPGNFLAVLWRIALLLQKNQHDLYGEQALTFFDKVLGKLLRTFKIRPQKEELRAGIHIFLAYLGALSSSTGGNALQCSLQLGLDQTPEGKAATRVILEGIIARKDKNGAWPKFVFVLQKGTNFLKGDPNYDLYQRALQAAIISGSPSFLIWDEPRGAPHVSVSTGPCTFSNGLQVLGNKYGLPGGEKRGNIASLTINLPRLALSARDEDLFFVELDRLLRLGVRQLLHRFEVLTSLQCKDLPFLMGNKLYRGSESLAPWESIQESLKNGLLTFNFTGLPEAVRVLTGEQPEGKQAGEPVTAILEHLSRRVRSFAEEYDLNIELCGVETGDKLSHFVEKDRHEFGFVPGVTDKDYYNSNFILFQEDTGLADKIALEAVTHRYCSAGHASRAVLLSGMEAAGAEGLILELVEAGIRYLSLSTLCQG